MVYLLHFNQKYKHAGHYLGYADPSRPLPCRLAEHERGAGARLTQVVKGAGIGWELVRTWQGDRKFERKLKNQKNAPKLCPVCKAAAKAAKEATNGDNHSDHARGASEAGSRQQACDARQQGEVGG